MQSKRIAAAMGSSTTLLVMAYVIYIYTEYSDDDRTIFAGSIQFKIEMDPVAEISSEIGDFRESSTITFLRNSILTQ